MSRVSVVDDEKNAPLFELIIRAGTESESVAHPTNYALTIYTVMLKVYLSRLVALIAFDESGDFTGVGRPSITVEVLDIGDFDFFDRNRRLCVGRGHADVRFILSIRPDRYALLQDRT